MRIDIDHDESEPLGKEFLGMCFGAVAFMVGVLLADPVRAFLAWLDTGLAGLVVTLLLAGAVLLVGGWLATKR